MGGLTFVMKPHCYLLVRSFSDIFKINEFYVQRPSYFFDFLQVQVTFMILLDCFSDKYFLEVSCGRAVKLENNTKNRSISHRAAAAAAATLVRFLKENY